MVKTKVFVGNLSFKTAEADLTKEFEAAGKVASANIISRGNRSLGYGFVEMESEEDAKKAVELLDKKVIDGREINVEVAKPRVENPAAANNGAAADERKPRRPRQPRAAGANGAANNAAPAGQAAEGAEGDARRRRTQRPRRPRKAAGEAGAPAAAGEAGAAPQAKPRRERQPRQPRADAPQRQAAPNTLFVANLPFSVDDAGLSQIFAGLNLKTAHVVRKRNNRSKGFGFVEFNNEDDQKKALAAVDKKSVESRELIVKIARTENVAPGSPAVAEAKKEAAPASPKPTTA